MDSENMSASKSAISIAIIGGGLGGVCAAIALGRLGYAVHVFEQAPQFHELGAGVGIGPNAFRALRMIAPDLQEAYQQVAEVHPEGSLWCQVRKWDDHEHIFDLHGKGGCNTLVHRARALDAFLPLLPSNVSVEFSAHVTKVENIRCSDERPARVQLSIAPSEHRDPEWQGNVRTFDADIVIGCDGVKSAVRHSLGLTGQDGSGGQVRYTGSYAYRELLDMETAVRMNGEGVRVPAMWYAPGKHMMTFPIEHGTVLNVVAFVSDRSLPADERVWNGPWVKQVSQQTMLNDFSDWAPWPRRLLEAIKEPKRWAMFELVPLERWTLGRVTLLGDAAHASLPYNGVGAGMAIEDVYVLRELLASPKCTRDTIPEFLQAYEAVRRPRASKQQLHSRESGEIYELASPLGSDFRALAEAVPGRYDWIWMHDISLDVEKAKGLLQSKGLVD